MDERTQAFYEEALSPGLARLAKGATYARQALMTNPQGRQCILDGSQFSPSWRALPEAEELYQRDVDGEISELVDELFNEWAMDQTRPNGETVAWEDGCLWVYGPEYDHSEADAPANDELQSTDGVTYEVFVGPQRVGWKATRGEDVEYVYLVPSTDTDDGVPNVFLYSGRAADPALDAPEVHVTHFGREPTPLLATPANMRKIGDVAENGTRPFSYSPTTNERFSATAGDYFQISDDTPLRDGEGEPMILAYERTEIVPYTIQATANDSSEELT